MNWKKRTEPLAPSKSTSKPRHNKTQHIRTHLPECINQNGQQIHYRNPHSYLNHPTKPSHPRLMGDLEVIGASWWWEIWRCLDLVAPNCNHLQISHHPSPSPISRAPETIFRAILSRAARDRERFPPIANNQQLKQPLIGVPTPRKESCCEFLNANRLDSPDRVQSSSRAQPVHVLLCGTSSDVRSCIVYLYSAGVGVHVMHSRVRTVSRRDDPPTTATLTSSPSCMQHAAGGGLLKLCVMTSPRAFSRLTRGASDAFCAIRVFRSCVGGLGEDGGLFVVGCWFSRSTCT